MNDYEARKQARIERYRAQAEKAGQRSTEEFKTFDRMMDALPMGQPILVGHHSEQRDRYYRDRAGRHIEKSIAESEKAAYYEQKARAAENNMAISSDDPEALEKLKAKLEKLEKKQMLMKRINSYYRKHKTCVGFGELTEEQARKIDASMEGYQSAPFEPYMLQNNNANIRRYRDRIANLQTARENPPEGWEFSGGRVEMDTEINRVQILFEEIPPKEFRQYMHRKMRFNWSPSNEAWQRQLNRDGVTAARRVTQKFDAEFRKGGSLMAYFSVCPLCGSNLDPGEKCDCQKQPINKKKGEKNNGETRKRAPLLDMSKNPVACCENCQNLDPIGEGDHICDEDPTRMPVCEYEPTEDYLWCKAKYFLAK